MKGAQCMGEGCEVIIKVTGRYCGKCKVRNARRKKPMHYVFQTIVYNARRRKIFCNLTFDEFKEFCLENNYMELKGVNGDDMTIDRDVPELGYTKGNLKMITRIDNSIKRFTDKYSISNKGIEESTNKMLAELVLVNKIGIAPKDPPF